MIIVLIGYMGSGKSTIGKKLSKKLKFDLVDLDAYITDKEHKTVSDIFKNNGEIYFRRLEARFLKDILENRDDIVLALGGGTPCYGNNMQLISDKLNAKSVYLNASVSKLSKKLFKKKAKRPLIAHIKTEDDMAEFVGKHLFERYHYYNQADYIILTDGKSKKKIVKKIMAKLF